MARDCHAPAGGQPRLRRHGEARAGLLFILPWLIALLVFTAYPVLGDFHALLHRIQQSFSLASLDRAR